MTRQRSKDIPRRPMGREMSIDHSHDPYSGVLSPQPGSFFVAANRHPLPDRKRTANGGNPITRDAEESPAARPIRRFANGLGCVSSSERAEA
jgi:hypothetical protein